MEHNRWRWEQQQENVQLMSPHEQSFCCPPDGPGWQQTNSRELQTAASPLDSLHNPDDLAVSPTWPAGRPYQNRFWLWYWTNCGETRCKSSLFFSFFLFSKNKPLGTFELFLELLLKLTADLHILKPMGKFAVFWGNTFNTLLIFRSWQPTCWSVQAALQPASLFSYQNQGSVFNLRPLTEM